MQIAAYTFGHPLHRPEHAMPKTKARTSDFGSMELYASSVIASDPFRVADVLRAYPSSPAH